MRMRKLVRTSLRTFAALAVALALVAAPAALHGREAAPSQEQARVIKVKILGMSCPFCAYGAQQKLKKLDGVEKLNVELKSGIATLTMKEGADVSNGKLKETVKNAGFEAAAIIRSFESEFEDWNPEEFPEGERFGPSGKSAGPPPAG